MRTKAITAARVLLVLALAAAAADLPLPSTTRGRIRVHLVDRSASALVPGGPDSFTPDDAAGFINYDRDPARKAAEDVILSASFGADVVFENIAVDPLSSNLEGALEAALARNPTEIVLYSDGRADPGRGALLCRTRGVPVHVLGAGPVDLRDARIRAVTEVEPGVLDVTIESTFSGPLTVKAGETARALQISAGNPASIRFTLPPGPFRISIEEKDACPENSRAEGEILVRGERRRVLALSAGAPAIPGVDMKSSAAFENPQGYDAVIVDGAALSEDQQRLLARYARDFGGGVLLLGGPRSYALGGWARAPLDDLSPLRAFPEGDLAVAFVLDRSGSMEGVLPAVTAVLLRARAFMSDEDRILAISFSNDVTVHRDPAELRQVRANGGTLIVPALDAARLALEPLSAARKHVVILTDGETKEAPEELLAGVRRLRDREISITLVSTTGKPEGLGTLVRIADWPSLSDRFRRLLTDIRAVERKNPGTLEPRPGPVELPAVPIPWMNLTAARRDASVVASAGGAPAAAFRQAGRGRVGAFAFGLEVPLGAAWRKAVEYVAGEGASGRTITVDPPVVRVRGTGPARMELVYQVAPSGESGPLIVDQVGSELWEGRLPVTGPGTLFVTDGRARAAAVIPCRPEFQSLGVDRAALERLAEETGGRVIRSRQDLESLPRPERSEPRPGRPLFLGAALLLLFAEMAFSTFWKAPAARPVL